MGPIPQSSSRAFSLVEVTLAIGILGFALVSIMGLLAVGIDSSRNSSNDTVTSLIAQDVFDRIRQEVVTVNPPSGNGSPGNSMPLDRQDLRWNAKYAHKPGYAEIGNTQLDPVSSQPGETVAAYYALNGTFVREAVDGAAAANYYRAAVYIRPLPASVYTSMNLVPVTTAGVVDYPLLAVTVNVGWPAATTKDGKVTGPVVNNVPVNAARNTFSFFLTKP